MPVIKIKKEDLLHDVTLGLKNQEIAEKYGVTLQCVKQRLYTVYKKMGVRNRAELIAVLNDNEVKKEECPYCGWDEFYIEHESSEDLSFRRECSCSKCERYFILNYDLKLTSILEVE